MKTLVALAALALVTIAASSSIGAPPGAPTTRLFTLHATAYACATQADGVCLGYNGVTPAQTMDVNLGDTVVVTLVNDIATTLPAGAPPHLSTANVSYHVHGMAMSVANDGVPAHAGTQLPDSTAGPGVTRVYTFRAAHVGVWHYHDHTLGADGAEGVKRGLFGMIVVRSGSEPRPNTVIDAHILDDGFNGGAPLAAAAVAGKTFEVDVVGLGEFIWSVTLESPNGTAVGTLLIGPGISERFVVPQAQVGTYTLTAKFGPFTKHAWVVVS